MISLNWKLRQCSVQFVFTPISFDPTGREGIIVLHEVTDPDFEGESVLLQLNGKEKDNVRNPGDL